MNLDFEVKLNGENPDLLFELSNPVSVDSNAYPVLTRALENVVPAHSVRIEGDGGFENWQQIFRSPFAYGFEMPDHFGSESFAALRRLLTAIEAFAVDGIPGFTLTPIAQGRAMPLATMGGVRHYLGRDLRPDDEIALRPLQMPVLLLKRGEFDLYSDTTHHGEWLCETSLWVKAKELTPA